MAKEMKVAIADELRTELDAAVSVLVVSLGAMNAETTVELRGALRDQGARLRVIHNRATRYALAGARQPLGEYFTGQTALALVPDADLDIVAIAKSLMDAQKNKSLQVRGGFVDGEVLDAATVGLLSQSPDKPTLRGMLAGTILGAARGIAMCLNGVPEGLARCLQARIDQSTENES